MLDESILNFQITIFLVVGTIIFMFVNFKRRDLIIYLPTYILIPIGYLFIYLQIYNYSYRLLGNAIFLIGNLTLLIAIFFEYFKVVNKKKNNDSNRLILNISYASILIFSIQIFFSFLLLLAIIMLVNLYSIQKSSKHASLIIFLSSGFITAIATVLSNFDLPGMWEFSFVGMFFFCTCYFVFPILIYLEEKLVTVGTRLIESEERYRLISENANDLIAMVNNKYEYEYINEPAYLTILGYSKKDLLGKHVFEIIHPEDIKYIVNSRDISTSNFQELKGIDKEELRARHKKGHYIWLEYTSKVFSDDQGNLKVIVISRDITKRKKADIELRESEEKFRVISEQSFIGAVIEQDFDIKYLNPQLAKIFGYNTQELLNWKIPDFFKIIHPDDLNRFQEIIDEKTKNLIQDIEDFKFRIIKKTGEILWIDLFSKAIMYHDKPANLAFVMDITELKKVEEIVREENRRLKELNKLRKELITRVSHELRTPLTTIYGASQMLLRTNRDENIEKIWNYLEISHRGAKRLKELVDNLLDISRLDNKKLDITTSNINLALIIQDCIKELMYQANNREITIIDDLPPEYFFIIDKHRFAQVIVNIISNAIKNTPPGGKVFVNLNDTIDYLDIQVKDTGVGLTPKEKTQLFEKFGKIERYGMNLDVDIEGAGLGLYISKEIVKLHGGEILVESEGRNQGSIFTIRLNKKG
ncbi:MAG: PAS domain S-box protein [Candidatus Hermodarchaeota archaeon]